MKKLLIALVVVAAFVSVSAAMKTDSSSYEKHAKCLSKEDVMWFSDRSKSGIPRTCTESVLQQNLSQNK